LPLLTTTKSTLPNVPLPHSRNTSLRGWPLSTGTALYNCGMNFCTKTSLHLTFSVSHAVIPANLPTRRSTALMTSTKLQSRQSVLKALSTTTLLSVPAGCHTELMHSTLAPPPSTIGLCNFTCQPPNDVALWTHGVYTQAIAQYQLFQLLISWSLHHATCSGHYKIPSQHPPAKPLPAVWLPITHVPSSTQPCPPAPQLQG
jgi:hypothetical protein